MKKLTNEEFIKKAQTIHGDKYDYLDTYINSMTPMRIKCKKCKNIFTIIPNNHLSKMQGCPLCYSNKPHKPYSIDAWIELCSIRHNNYYQYDKDKLNYVNGHSIVNIICPKHGEFSMLARHHIAGHGCNLCAKEHYIATHRKSNDVFLQDAKTIHGDKYEYLDEYVNAKTKLKILCKNCGNIFEQTPHKHINGKQGCPHCQTSKLEDFIKLSLIEENINFEQQKRFEWLGLQSLDFYLPDYNVAIECQGKQHFGIGGWSSVSEKNKEEFQIIQERDTRKSKLCEENGIKILYFADKHYTNAPYKLFIDKTELLNEIINHET